MTKEERPTEGAIVGAVSPIGSTAASAHARRMAQDPEYAREWDAQATAREIAWQLVRYRLDHQLTQEELARLAGTSHSQISRLESGQHLPSVATLGKIASALRLRLAISFEPWPETAAPALD
jgi:DNA-binding XRE family transcriptional regulator